MGDDNEFHVDNRQRCQLCGFTHSHIDAAIKLFQRIVSNPDYQNIHGVFDHNVLYLKDKKYYEIYCTIYNPLESYAFYHS
jgi:hypothetical protein